MAETITFPNEKDMGDRLGYATVGMLQVRALDEPDQFHTARLWYAFNDHRVHKTWVDRLVRALAGRTLGPEQALIDLTEAMIENMRTAPWTRRGVISDDDKREYSLRRNDLIATLCATAADPPENATLMHEAVEASEDLQWEASAAAIRDGNVDGLPDGFF